MIVNKLTGGKEMKWVGTAVWNSLSAISRPSSASFSDRRIDAELSPIVFAVGPRRVWHSQWMQKCAARRSDLRIESVSARFRAIDNADKFSTTPHHPTEA